MPTYTVVEPIKHKGTRHQPGESVEMSPKEAAALPEGTLAAPAETKKPAKGQAD
jgi:hypothetical protein